MSIRFNADEIFEMAQQIERNGAKFYRRAAQGVSDPQNQDLLLQFAKMEDDHLETFTAMRADMLKTEGRKVSIDPAFDPEGEAALYLQAMADANVFDAKSDVSELLTGKETLEEIFQIAVGKEKDSVVFYVGMRDMVPENLGKEKIDDIIKEEMKHIRILGTELAKIRQQ